MTDAALGAPGVVARVRLVSPDGATLYLEFRNGTAVPSTLSDRADIHVGDIVLVTEVDGGQRLEKAPPELWPDEPSVGVVRLKLDDVTVVDSSGRFRLLPTTDVGYEVGNTVLFGEYSGVSRLLSEQPIRYLDLPSIEGDAAERFRSPNAGGSLSWEDFGGLEDVVRRARELVELPLKKRSRLAKVGARPIKGVLFTGDPGTGKTRLAKIIAATSGATFFEISGPEIFSRWYGQSEEILRLIFESAAKEESAIIFFDEIDSVAARRRDESHEASKRVVAQLLTLMDGFDADSNVVVIATSNRPDDIDPALRRPGRFDWEIRFPMPSASDRRAILKASARGLATSADLPHDLVADLTNGWSGAELAAIWIEASILAVDDDRESITAEDYLGGVERIMRQRVAMAAPTLRGDG